MKLKAFKRYLPYFVVVVGTLVLYLASLDKVPVHLNQDELMFSLNAYSVSKGLNDYYGNFLPFYFWHLGSFWATPIIVYLTSLFLRAFPLSESTIRLSSVFVGLSSIVLLMILVGKIFKDKKLTIISGVLMATTPVLFIHSRLLLDNLYFVPFVLLWLLLLKVFLDSKRRLALFASILSLGVGIHSYHAAKIVAPIYFLATLFLLFPEIRKNLKLLVIAFAAFLIPIIIFIPWLTRYPDTLLNQVSYIGSLDKTIDVQKGIWGVFDISRLGNFVSSYFTYFSPKILFTEGDRSMIHSTGEVGAFLFPIIFLLAFGILKVVFKEKDRFSKLILLGLLTYPVAPALVSDPQRISRGLVVIPFVILLSIYGIKFLLDSREKAFKPFLVAILITSMFQFTFFLADYFDKYRERSYTWFNQDIGGALESAIRSTQIRKVATVYLDEHTPFIDLYFRFYQIKLGKNLNDLWEFYDFKSEDFSRFPPASLVVLRTDHAPGRQDRIGPFEKIETIREPDGNESFYIYYRDPAGRGKQVIQ